jgi:hypothetical protein
MLQLVAEGAHNDPIAGAEPKVPILQTIQRVVVFDRIIGTAERKRRGIAAKAFNGNQFVRCKRHLLKLPITFPNLARYVVGELEMCAGPSSAREFAFAATVAYPKTLAASKGSKSSTYPAAGLVRR